MFFTKLGRIVAFAGLALSVAHFIYLQVFTFNAQASTGEISLPGDRVFDAVLESSKETGTVFLFSVVLGILAEISRSLSAKAKE